MLEYENILKAAAMIKEGLEQGMNRAKIVCYLNEKGIHQLEIKAAIHLYRDCPQRIPSLQSLAHVLSTHKPHTHYTPHTHTTHTTHTPHTHHTHTHTHTHTVPVLCQNPAQSAQHAFTIITNELEESGVTVKGLRWYLVHKQHWNGNEQDDALMQCWFLEMDHLGLHSVSLIPCCHLPNNGLWEYSWNVLGMFLECFGNVPECFGNFFLEMFLCDFGFKKNKKYVC